MHVMRSGAAYLAWRDGGTEALLVDWDEGVVPELDEAVAREGLRPVWHARTSGEEPPREVAEALAARYPGLRTAWFPGCGTLRLDDLKVDLVWAPRTGAGGLAFVVDERVAFVGALPAAAAARDERAARSLEVVREFASEAELHPAP